MHEVASTKGAAALQTKIRFRRFQKRDMKKKNRAFGRPDNNNRTIE